MKQNQILSQIHKTTVSVLEKRMEKWASAMIIAPGTKEHGGIPWDGSGLVHIAWHDKGSVSFIPKALALWREPLSRYFHDSGWLEKIDLAIDFVFRNLPRSGLLSMIYCNFSSPADTGFAMYGFGPTLELMRKEEHVDLSAILPKLEELTNIIGSALVNGGIHTPNHRWSNVQSLGWLWRLFGNEKARAYAEEWLAEGIDISCDGEYMERSMNYSNHSNRSLMSAAYTLEKPELLAAPEKNLHMLPFLVHQDDHCVTEISARNDAGVDVHISRFLESAYLYHAFSPGPFSAMLVQKCSESFLRSQQDDQSYITPSTADLLPWIQLFPPQSLSWPQPEPWPTDYVKRFGDEKLQTNRRQLVEKLVLPYKKDMTALASHYNHGAPFVRIRRGKLSATIQTFNDAVAALRYGKARLSGLYCCLSYFGAGPVFASELAQAKEGWVLSRPDLRAEFMGPLNRPLQMLDMQRDERPSLNRNRMNWQVVVAEITDGLSFRFRASGAVEESGDELPVLAQIVLQFPLSGKISAAHILNKDEMPDANLPGYVKNPMENDLYLKTGSAVYEYQGDAIEISGGAMQHTMPLMLGDTLSQTVKSLRINLVFPGEHTVEIRGM
ncbi:MAG: hypothetical protein GWP06_06395 [Actinobacteria bacterium]|nr:hypothetical protein [Actinomycetota bacterium]